MTDSEKSALAERLAGPAARTPRSNGTAPGGDLSDALQRMIGAGAAQNEPR